MSMQTYLRKRKSIRDFKPNALKPNDRAFVEQSIKDTHDEFDWNDVSLDFILEGEKVYEAFDGKAGYAGVMIKAPHYVRVTESADNLMVNTKAAFDMASFTSKLVENGIANCIITLGDNIEDAKKQAFGDNWSGKAEYLIAIGYPEDKGYFEKVKPSERYSVSEIVFEDEDMDHPATELLENLNMLELFSVLRFSPSYKNKQPWRFVVTSSEIYAYVLNDAELAHSLTDMGMIMYYFQELVEKMGIDGSWEIATELDTSKGFIKLGRFKI